MRFYHGKMIFEVPGSVYCPREDSLILAKVIEELDIVGREALEVGCGCGFLSVLMAKKGASVTAVDINKQAVEATKRNAAANDLHVTCLYSDIFSTVTGKYDLIIFNPPYLPDSTDLETVSNIRKEPAGRLMDENILRQWSGGSTGREVAERFIADSGKFLKFRGTVLLSASSLTGEKELLRFFENSGFRASVVAREKIPWEELFVIHAERF